MYSRLVIVLVALVVLMVGGVGGCETVIPSLPRQGSESAAFRGNVFRILTSGVITGVSTRIPSTWQRVVIHRAANWTTPPASWTGLFDETVLSNTTGFVHHVSVEVTAGDVIMVGMDRYRSPRRKFPLHQARPWGMAWPSSCVEWLAKVDDPSVQNAARFSAPANPTFSTLYVHETSIVLSNGTRSCPMGSNGMVCSGYPCSSVTCKCPPRSGAGQYVDASCSPIQWVEPACDGHQLVSLRTEGEFKSTFRSIESNSVLETYPTTLCSWRLFPPDSESGITLSFLRLDTEPGADVLSVSKFYRPAGYSSPFRYDPWGSFSGQLPAGEYFEITICGSVRVKFEPNAASSPDHSGFYIGISVSTYPNTSCVESAPMTLPPPSSDDDWKMILVLIAVPAALVLLPIGIALCLVYVRRRRERSEERRRDASEAASDSASEEERGGRLSDWKHRQHRIMTSSDESSSYEYGHDEDDDGGDVA